MKERMTVKEAAELLGCDQQTVRMWPANSKDGTSTGTF